MNKTVVILSGGLDSTVLLHSLLHDGHEVRALAFDYGQRHRRELLFAQSKANWLGIPFERADLRRIAGILPGSSLTDKTVAVPEGHYAEESMKATVVPNRNMIMLSIAVGHAIAHGCNQVAYGAHAGDHAIYPDCRPEFVRALQDAVTLCDWNPVKLHGWFLNKTKADIVKIGASLGVDFRMTYSCYSGKQRHCGNCGTCVERREAFWLAGVADPTDYARTAKPLDQLLKISEASVQ